MRLSPLTPRQLEIAGLLYDGLGARTIAHQLGLSIHTVHRHMQDGKRRLGDRRRPIVALATHYERMLHVTLTTANQKLHQN